MLFILESSSRTNKDSYLISAIPSVSKMFLLNSSEIIYILFKTNGMLLSDRKKRIPDIYNIDKYQNYYNAWKKLAQEYLLYDYTYVKSKKFKLIYSD